MNPSWRRAFAVFLFSVWQGWLPFCFWNPAPGEHSPHLVTKVASPQIGSWPWSSFLAFCHLFQWISHGAESQNLLRAPTTWETWGAGAVTGWGPVSLTPSSCVLALHREIAALEHWFYILMLLGSAHCPQVHCSHQGCVTSSFQALPQLPALHLPSPICLPPVFLWLIHISVQQKQHCKATILQLKTNF